MFGWRALRKKLVVRAAGLDETVVELLKLDLMRRLTAAALGTGRELRVLAVDDDVLSFAWIPPETETERFACDRAPYDAIAGNPDGWAPIRAQLTNGPFVDMQKTLHG